MRRSTAVVRKMQGAISFGLMLPISFTTFATTRIDPKHADFLPVSFISSSYSNSTLERWRGYALSSVTPAFAWSLPVTGFAQAPVLLDNVTIDNLHGTLFSRIETPTTTYFQVRLETSRASDTPAQSVHSAHGVLLPDTTLALNRYLLAPGIWQHWGEQGMWNVSAILAYQRFASLGMGSVAWKDSSMAPSILREEQTSFGSGVRFDASNELGDKGHWSLGFQSRVNMDAFNNYRGMFSEPGDFDIPASANFTLDFLLAPQFGLEFGVQRVLYSDIAPFTSASLPTRFLALLGDGNSPVFAWQDLTVYSLGWRWRDALNSDWQLRYSTREQPSPTSQILSQALKSQLSNHSIELSFAHAFGDTSQFRFVASYAPVEYVLGAPTSFNVRDNYGGNQFEFEALWSYRF